MRDNRASAGAHVVRAEHVLVFRRERHENPQDIADAALLLGEAAQHVRGRLQQRRRAPDRGLVEQLGDAARACAR
jgi:alpha-ketoglutarate-dependent taurine dioxygenase